MTAISKITTKQRSAHTRALTTALALCACGVVMDTLASERVVIPGRHSDAELAAAAPDSANPRKPLTPTKARSGLSTLYVEYRDYWTTATAALRTAEPFRSRRTLSQVTSDGRVVVDAVAVDDAEQLAADLDALGAEVSAIAGRMVSARLPIDRIPDLEGVPSLAFARPAVALTNSGDATSRGDLAIAADTARQAFSVDGTGVKVGIISDSFDCSRNGSWGFDLNSDDLPLHRVTILDDRGKPVPTKVER